MAVIEGGTSGSLGEVGVGAAKGMHVISKPTDHGALGSYSWGGATGTIPAALGANSEILQFRWTDATRLCVVTKVRISAAVSTTFFAAGVPMHLDLVKATGWTVAGTGGATVTPAATLKKRTSMGSTLIAAGDIRPATTAALGAGTKTLEGNSLTYIVAACPITASLNGTIIAPNTDLFHVQIGDGEHPLVLAANEGFVVRAVAVPATGTWTMSFTVHWTEVTAF